MKFRGQGLSVSIFSQVKMANSDRWTLLARNCLEGNITRTILLFGEVFQNFLHLKNEQSSLYSLFRTENERNYTFPTLNNVCSLFGLKGDRSKWYKRSMFTGAVQTTHCYNRVWFFLFHPLPQSGSQME